MTTNSESSKLTDSSRTASTSATEQAKRTSKEEADRLKARTVQQQVMLLALRNTKRARCKTKPSFRRNLWRIAFRKRSLRKRRLSSNDSLNNHDGYRRPATDQSW